MKYILLSMNPGYERWLGMDNPPAVKGVYRASTVEKVASGKGVNVARCFLRMGFYDYGGLYIAGGDIGALLEKELKNEGIALEPFHIADETRVNVIAMLGYDKSSIVINEPGPVMEKEEIRAFYARYLKMLKENPAAGVIISGSAPRGFGEEDYLSLLDGARRMGNPLVVDIGGKLLVQSVKGPLDVLKINREEFLAAFGFDPWEHGEEAWGFALNHKINTLIVTDGLEGSRAWNKEEGQFFARFDHRCAGSYAVGSGDSYLAGYLMAWARGMDMKEALRQATALGMANAHVLAPGMVDEKTVSQMAPNIWVEAL